jgi:disulfide bond formation protein DsbB
MENQLLHTIFALGSISLQIFTVIMLLGFVYPKISIHRYVEGNSVKMIFVLALAAMLGSLGYSEVIGYAPCTLCWYQRILMYPLVFMGVSALIKKAKVEFLRYAAILTGFGSMISLYHAIIKMTGVAPIPCSAYAVSGADCVKQLVLEFGYINIPMMSFSIFITIFVISVVSIYRKK